MTTSKYKSAVDFPFQCPFFEGEIVPGKVYDLPDTQPDGSDLVWPEEFWTRLDASPVTPTPENESSQ